MINGDLAFSFVSDPLISKNDCFRIIPLDAFPAQIVHLKYTDCMLKLWGNYQALLLDLLGPNIKIQHRHIKVKQIMPLLSRLFKLS